MHTYKELSFVGDNPAFDAFMNNAPWKSIIEVSEKGAFKIYNLER